MRSFTTSFLALGLLAVSTGCASLHWGDFRKLSVDPAVAAAATPAGKKAVSGSACRAFLRPRHVADAVRAALKEAPGARALVNVEITVTLYGLFNCLSVEGTPVK